MSFGRVQELPYWGIHHTVEQQGHVVTTGAPAARPGTDDILHVFNRFAVPLVIERRKPMRRLRPLSVNVRVAVGTALRGHEKVGRNLPAGVGKQPGGVEWPALAVHPLIILAERWQLGVCEVIRVWLGSA